MAMSVIDVLKKNPQYTTCNVYYKNEMDSDKNYKCIYNFMASGEPLVNTVSKYADAYSTSKAILCENIVVGVMCIDLTTICIVVDESLENNEDKVKADTEDNKYDNISAVDSSPYITPAKSPKKEYMTVGDLRSFLSHYSDDTKVCIFEGFNTDGTFVLADMTGALTYFVPEKCIAFTTELMGEDDEDDYDDDFFFETNDDDDEG